MNLIKNQYVIIMMALSFASCGPPIYKHSLWQQNSVVADGRNNDWHLPLQFYERNSMMQYDITNDSENLYLAFSTYDKMTKIRILSMGIQVAIDTSGGNAYPFVISYPVLPKGEYRNASMRYNSGNTDSASARNNASIEARMKLFGFKPEVGNNIAPGNNDFGIEAKTGRGKDSNFFCEMVIPFKTFYKAHLTSADTAKPFSYQITLDPLEQTGEHKFQGGSRPGGSNGGMGAGGMSGGMGAGGMGGGMGAGGYGGGGGGRPMGGGGGGNASQGSGMTMKSNPYEEVKIKVKLLPSVK